MTDIQRLRELLAKISRWSPGYDHYPDDLDPDGDWVRYEDISELLNALPNLLADYERLRGMEERVKGAPVGEIRRVRFDEDERPTWHVVDDRDEVPLNEPKRVALVPVPGGE
jgi:hypothetical protein